MRIVNPYPHRIRLELVDTLATGELTLELTLDPGVGFDPDRYRAALEAMRS